jgi:hypothetical protein
MVLSIKSALEKPINDTITLIPININVIGAAEKFIQIIYAQIYCIILTMVVFFVAVNTAGPVYLLCQNQPHQLVGENQWRQAPFIIGSLHHGIANAISTAN